MMNSSNLIKVVAAFVTGILVALVGALTYVKVADRSPSEPVMTSGPVTKRSALPGRAAVEQATPEQAAPEESGPTPSAVTETQTKTEAEVNPVVKPTAESGAKPVRRDTLSSVGHKFTHRTSGAALAQLGLPKPSEPDTGNTGKVPANPYSGNQARASERPAPVAASDPPPVQAPSAEQPVQQVPARQPHSVTLEPGMSVAIRVNEALSTEHNYTGDTFRATLDSPIIINGFIIAEKGSKVLGRVVNAEKPGRVQGVADLSLALTEINTSDGQRIGIQTSSIDEKGGSNTGRNAGKVAGGAALGAIIGAIAGGGKGAGIGAGIGGAAGAGDVMLTHGKAAVIPNETVLTFRLAEPVTITERLN
jgi:hypothetical protein